MSITDLMHVNTMTYFLDIPTQNEEYSKFPCGKKFYEENKDNVKLLSSLARKVDEALDRRNTDNYSPIPFGETADLEDEEWLRWREHGPFYNDPFGKKYVSVGIGGSAVSAIFGDSPWMSRLELYHSKSETAIPKIKRPKNQEILDVGHMLEEFVSHQFVRKMQEEEINDIEMWNDTIMYQHPKYPFAVCNLDRMIRVNGIPCILECKTTGNFNDIKLWKEGIVPKKYEWQCRYYMATMNINHCYICCCWGFTLDETAVILIKRDLDIEKTMMEEVADFVKKCEMGIEPEMQTSHMDVLANYYSRLYGELPSSAPAVELPDNPGVYELVNASMTLFKRRKEAEDRLKAIDEEGDTIACKLMQIMGGESTYATYRLDDNQVVALKLKQPMHRATIDEEDLKKDHPEIYQRYLIKFDQTAFKKAEKKMAKEYTIPAKVNESKPISLDSVEIKNIPAASAV